MDLFLMKLNTGLHDTDDIFKVMNSKVKVTDNISRNALFWRRHYWSMDLLLILCLLVS